MNKRLKMSLLYLTGSLFVWGASQIYLSFVPGVTNLSMETGFVYVFGLGILEIIFFHRWEWLVMGKVIARLGMVTLVVVSFSQGVLDIALASHPWLPWGWLLGTVMMLSGLVYLFWAGSRTRIFQ